MKKRFINNVTFINIIRWWLTGLLILLPFQRRIVKGIVLWSNELSAIISYLDEITVVAFIPLAMREIYKNREVPDRLYFIFLLSILVLSISGLISGMVNENSLFITALGTFDYIKNFLVIIIYFAFFKEFSKLKRVFNSLLIIAVLLGIIAFVQEFWAIVSRYILEKDINDISYFLSKHKGPWRLGIYKVRSIMHNPNIFGLYCLLILTIYFSMVRKVNFVVILSLFSGIFLSVSRMAYAGFAFVSGIQILRGRRWLIALVAISIAVVLFSFSSLSEFDILKRQKELGFITFREYARMKAIEVWKDHPVWGVGPGMFGGTVAFKYRTPYHEEYNFFQLLRFHSLDQFWPQVWAEMGIIGTVAFAGLLISLFITLFALILRRQAISDEIRGFFTGLAVYLVVILIYSLGSGLNITSILFTYCAFVGMGLGCVDRRDFTFEPYSLAANEIEKKG